MFCIPLCFHVPYFLLRGVGADEPMVVAVRAGDALAGGVKAFLGLWVVGGGGHCTFSHSASLLVLRGGA